MRTAAVWAGLHPAVAVIAHSLSDLADPSLCHFRFALSEDDPSCGSTESFSCVCAALLTAVREPGSVGPYKLTSTSRIEDGPKRSCEFVELPVELELLVPLTCFDVHGGDWVAWTRKACD